MRWLHLLFIGLVATVSVSTAEARRSVVQVVDPVTGATTTEVIREREHHRDRELHGDREFHGDRDWHHRGFRRMGVLGAPVIARRGFPVAPFNGQRIWRAGRQWQFDAALGQWIIIR